MTERTRRGLQVELFEPVLDALHAAPPRLYLPARGTLVAIMEVLTDDQIREAMGTRDRDDDRPGRLSERAI